MAIGRHDSKVNLDTKTPQYAEAALKLEMHMVADVCIIATVCTERNLPSRHLLLVVR